MERGRYRSLPGLNGRAGQGRVALQLSKRRDRRTGGEVHGKETLQGQSFDSAVGIEGSVEGMNAHDVCRVVRQNTVRDGDTRFGWIDPGPPD